MMAHPALCDPLSLTAAFAVGMAGSVHCLAMCGGISTALGMRARSAASAGRASLLTASYQAGRLGGYALAGAFVGVCSTLLPGVVDPQLMVWLARGAAGLVLIAVGAGILFKQRPLAALERVGARLWRHLAPLARRIPPGGVTGSLLLGLLWGWLPCGFVYSMLLFAALKGGLIQSAALMLSFGLGTVPAVLGSGMVGAHASRLRWARVMHGAAGWLLLAFGIMTIIGPVIPGVH